MIGRIALISTCGVLIVSGAIAKTRAPRSAEFRGDPVAVEVRSQHASHISVPYPIRDITMPVLADKLIATKPTPQFPMGTTFIPQTLDGNVIVTIRTSADMTYTLELVPSDTPDSHVTITDPDEVRLNQGHVNSPDTSGHRDKDQPAQHVEAHINRQYERVRASPLDNAIIAVHYSQYLGKPLYGTSMQRVNRITKSDDKIEVRVIWRYHHPDGVYGFSQRITNRSHQPLPLDIRTKKDPGAQLHSAFLHNIGVQTIIKPGASVVHHLVYLREGMN